MLYNSKDPSEWPASQVMEGKITGRDVPKFRFGRT